MLNKVPEVAAQNVIKISEPRSIIQQQATPGLQQNITTTLKEKSILMDLNKSDDDFYDLFTKTPQKMQSTIDTSMLSVNKKGLKDETNSNTIDQFKMPGKSLFKKSSISPGKSRIPLPMSKMVSNRTTLKGGDHTINNMSQSSLLEPLVYNINASTTSQSIPVHVSDTIKIEKLSISPKNSKISTHIEDFSRIEKKSFHIKEECIEQSENIELLPSLKIISACTLSKFTDDAPHANKAENKDKYSTDISLSLADDELLNLSDCGGSRNATPTPTEDNNKMLNSIYVKHSPCKFTDIESLKYENWEEIQDESDDKTVTLTNNVFLPNIVNLNETKQIIETHLIAENANPFDNEVRAAFLDQLQLLDYLQSLPTCNLVNTVRPIRLKGNLEINDRSFCVEAIIGQGSFGHIFR